MKETQKIGSEKKNSAKSCPKTQPTSGFSLLKNYKKTPFMKKTGIFAPKTQFFPFKTQCTAGLRPELSCRKVYKKKPELHGSYCDGFLS